jgi:putative transposase
MWNLPPPPGFQGLREDLPLDVYLRHMPHWRQPGATYFVTSRLGDSLPQAKLQELAAIRREWDQQHPPPHSSAALQKLAKSLATYTETWLDQGAGNCELRIESLRNHLVTALHHFDDDRYELGAFVIMPNHIHAIVRPLHWSEQPLEAILKSWKQFSSRRIHREIGAEGALWQEESYDRIIRDEEHLYRCLQYIGDNPRKANLLPDNYVRWVRPTWIPLGWNFAS